MYSESDALAISALQHLLYCERQCALIHIEQLWTENRFTAEGRVLHERTEEHETESRGCLRIAYGVRLRSRALGLSGIADVVEFHRAEGDEPEAAKARLKGVKGRWRVFPVEFKRGRKKEKESDQVQLCAQAMCLEEMLECEIPSGALFYGQSRRRLDVEFGEALREQTRFTAERLHALIASGKTPPAVYEKKKCQACSLIDLCLPEIKTVQGCVAQYVHRMINETTNI